MIDRITTIPRNSVGIRIGQLEPVIISDLERALLVFLGLAGNATRRRRPSRSFT